MVHRVLIATIFVWLFAFSANANPFEEAFRTGLAAYQDAAYDKARESFAQALALEPGNTAAMANYALASYQLGEKGVAIAWFRRALTLEPDQRVARDGLRFALSKLEVKEIPHRIETYETLRKDVLQHAPARVFLALTALLILSSGWFLLTWLGARRRALRAQDVVPPFPWWTGVLLILAVIGSALTSLKLYDATLPRGTIVSARTAALSAPAQTGVQLFELFEGFEVLIQDVKDEWVQVSYPGGLTGWIPKKDLLSTDGGAR